MGQLLSIRFAMTCAALVGLLLVVNALVDDREGLSAAIAGTDPAPSRRIDLIEPVARFAPSDDFEIGADGLTVGYLDAVLDPTRVMRIAPGTPGTIDCPSLERPNRCVVLADLLGEAVVWFAVLPRGPRDTVELGPIVDLEGGYALFENGWQIPFPPVIERLCGDEDLPTFSDFLRQYGPGSTSIVDLETQQVVAVECGEPVPDPTLELRVGASIGVEGRIEAPPTSDVSG